MTTIYPNAAHTRTRLLASAPQIRDCPKCGANRGDYCKSSGGYQTSLVAYHAARRRLVAHLSEDEAYAAMVEVDAERRARQDAARAAMRERVQAQIDARVDDPQIREAQARTRAAWSRTAVEAAAEVGSQFRLRLVSEREQRPPLGPIRGVTDLAAVRARKAAERSSGGDVA